MNDGFGAWGGGGAYANENSYKEWANLDNNDQQNNTAQTELQSTNNTESNKNENDNSKNSFANNDLYGNNSYNSNNFTSNENLYNDSNNLNNNNNDNSDKNDAIMANMNDYDYNNDDRKDRFSKISNMLDAANGGSTEDALFNIFIANRKTRNQTLLKLVPTQQRGHWCMSYIWDLLYLKWIVLFEINFGIWIYSAEYDNNQPKLIIIGIIGLIIILLLCLCVTAIIASEIRARIRLFYAYLPLEIIILFDKTHPLRKKRFWLLATMSMVIFFLGFMIHKFSISHLQLGVTILVGMLLVTYDAMNFEKSLLPLHSFMRHQEFEGHTRDAIWKNFLAIDVSQMKAYIQTRKSEINELLDKHKTLNNGKKYKNEIKWVYSRDDLESFLRTDRGNDILNSKRYLKKIGGCCGKNNMRWAYGMPTSTHFTY